MTIFQISHFLILGKVMFARLAEIDIYWKGPAQFISQICLLNLKGTLSETFKVSKDFGKPGL